MTQIKTISVESHTCRDCGHVVASTNVPELCPNCGSIADWTTMTVGVAVAFAQRRAGDLASGTSGRVMM